MKLTPLEILKRENRGENDSELLRVLKEANKRNKRKRPTFLSRTIEKR